MKFSCFLLLHILLFICLVSEVVADENQVRISSVLVHRDSPQSPFYNSSEDHYVRLNRAIHRSFSRLEYFYQISRRNFSHHRFQRAGVIPSGGEYLMNISIGTPPYEVMGIMDTGSDLIWTQCIPCMNVTCFKQIRPYNYTESSSIVGVSCRNDSRVCFEISAHICHTESNTPCLYYRGYNDGSSTRGFLAREIFTLDTIYSTRYTIQNVVFGCGIDTYGFSNASTGIIGMNDSPYSLIQQMPVYKAFTYCLVPWTSSSGSSHIYFGREEQIGSGLSTPITKKPPPNNNFYYLSLDAITIGNQTIRVNPSSENWPDGNIVIDSGTPMTYVPNEFHERLERTLKEEMKDQSYFCKDPSGFLSLCYEWEKIKETPPFVVHFKGPLLVYLKNINIFVELSPGCFCFAFAGQGNSPTSIYGSIAQFNFRVTYDIESQGMEMVSFIELNCAVGQ